jgi:hypothetical protein
VGTLESPEDGSGSIMRRGIGLFVNPVQVSENKAVQCGDGRNGRAFPLCPGRTAASQNRS